MTSEPESVETRERHGRRVREVWLAWASQQPNPKPSWLLPWEELSEPEREVDRRIGAALWGDGFNDGLNAGYAGAATLHPEPLEEQPRCQTCGYTGLAKAFNEQRQELRASNMERDKLKTALRAWAHAYDEVNAVDAYEGDDYEDRAAITMVSYAEAVKNLRRLVAVLGDTTNDGGSDAD